MKIVGVMLLNRIYIPTITIDFIKPLLFEKAFQEYWVICFCYWLVECRVEEGDMQCVLGVVEMGIEHIQQKK